MAEDLSSLTPLKDSLQSAQILCMGRLPTHTHRDGTPLPGGMLPREELLNSERMGRSTRPGSSCSVSIAASGATDGRSVPHAQSHGNHAVKTGTTSWRHSAMQRWDNHDEGDLTGETPHPGLHVPALPHHGAMPALGAPGVPGCPSTTPTGESVEGSLLVLLPTRNRDTAMPSL
jgi:hypothetical protein